jgi:TIR domain
MSDIFISYAREDLDRARRLASALESRGWSVWWDRRIVAGQTFDQAIERELESARSVVVLWSKDSIESEWTKNEATAAAERNVLVPALLDDVRIPLEFRRKQTANLIDWDGEASHEGFQALCEGVAGRIGPPSGTGPTQVLPPPPPPRWPIASGWRTWTAAAAVAVAATTAAALWWNAGDADRPRAPAERDTTKPPVPNPAAPPGGGLEVAPPNVAGVPPPDANGIDNPAPIGLGAVHKVTLDRNEDYYFRLSSPAGTVKILQDMRVSDESRTLMSELSILDEHGAVLQADALSFSESDVASRKTAVVSLKPPMRAGLRLLNKGPGADFWIAVLAAEAPSFIPLFGSVVPRQMSPARDASGSLDGVEDVYCTTRLTRGGYRIVADFSRAKRDIGTIHGFVSILDADGGNEQRLVSFSEHDTKSRQVATFLVKKDEPRILRIQNATDTINYAVKIEKTE